MSLRDEFESGKRRHRTLMVAGAVCVAALTAVIIMWPKPTLRDAVQNEDFSISRQLPNHADWSGTSKLAWNWADESRRADLLDAFQGDRGSVDALLKAAGGRRFLFWPLGRDGAGLTDRGVQVFLWLPTDKITTLAREPKGGPVLNLQPFKIAPRMAAVPLDNLAPFVTDKPTGRDTAKWHVYLGSDYSENGGGERTEKTLLDPLVVAAVLKGQQP